MFPNNYFKSYFPNRYFQLITEVVKTIMVMVDTVWKTVNKVYIMVSGEWKEAVSIYVKSTIWRN